MRIIEVICETSHANQISRLASQAKVVDWWSSNLSNNRTLVKLLVSLEHSGKVLDTMQSATEGKNCRIIIYKADDIQPVKKDKDTALSSRIAASRQEIYADIEKNARIDSTFILLVILSTVVAAIGLIQGSETVIIGAMVIAPLLGPNLALSLATSLGDVALMLKSLGTLLLGLTMAIGLSYLVGFVSPIVVSDVVSDEIFSRTIVGLESMALAFASGAAAALSMTTGVSSVLVGVMVAVALLPPASTIGLMLSTHDYTAALGAGLLLAVNIVAVNLSTKLVFLFKGIKPRTEEELIRARSWKYASLVVWFALFIVLGTLIYWKAEVFPGDGADPLISLSQTITLNDK